MSGSIKFGIFKFFLYNCLKESNWKPLSFQDILCEAPDDWDRKEISNNLDFCDEDNFITFENSQIKVSKNITTELMSFKYVYFCWKVRLVIRSHPGKFLRVVSN